MTKVFLYGKLGDMFGQEFSFKLKTPKDAFAAIGANRRGFAQEFKKQMMEGTIYRIVVDDSVIEDPKDLELARKPKEIHLVPVVWGSGKNVGMALAFIVLAVVTFGAGTILAGATNSTVAAIGGGLKAVAISFAISGVMALIFPPPKPNFSQETSAGAKSYIFGGTLNSERQGGPVPVGYGRLLVGTSVISSQIRNYDMGSDIRSLFTPASKPTVLVPTPTSTELSFANRETLLTTVVIASNNYIDIRSNLAVDLYSAKVKVSVFVNAVDKSDEFKYTWRLIETTAPNKFAVHNGIDGYTGYGAAIAYGDEITVTQTGFANDPREVFFRGKNTGTASSFVMATYICEATEITTGERVKSPVIRVAFSWFGGSTQTEETSDTNTEVPTTATPPPASAPPPPDPIDYSPKGDLLP